MSDLERESIKSKKYEPLKIIKRKTYRIYDKKYYHIH